MSLIDLVGIYTAYEGGDKAVIKGLSLQVGKGEYVVIGGPNSAGKTTLLESINGLVRITQGRATVCGLDVCRQGRKCARGRAMSYRTSILIPSHPSLQWRW